MSHPTNLKQNSLPLCKLPQTSFSAIPHFSYQQHHLSTQKPQNQLRFLPPYSSYPATITIRQRDFKMSRFPLSISTSIAWWRSSPFLSEYYDSFLLAFLHQAFLPFSSISKSKIDYILPLFRTLQVGHPVSLEILSSLSLQVTQFSCSNFRDSSLSLLFIGFTYFPTLIVLFLFPKFPSLFFTLLLIYLLLLHSCNCYPDIDNTLIFISSPDTSPKLKIHISVHLLSSLYSPEDLHSGLSYSPNDITTYLFSKIRRQEENLNLSEFFSARIKLVTCYL